MKNKLKFVYFVNPGIYVNELIGFAFTKGEKKKEKGEREMSFGIRDDEKGHVFSLLFFSCKLVKSWSNFVPSVWALFFRK